MLVICWYLRISVDFPRRFFLLVLEVCHIYDIYDCHVLHWSYSDVSITTSTSYNFLLLSTLCTRLLPSAFCLSPEFLVYCYTSSHFWSTMFLWLVDEWVNGDLWHRAWWRSWLFITAPYLLHISSVDYDNSHELFMSRCICVASLYFNILLHSSI